MVEGKLVNWNEGHLHLRTHLADGTAPDGTKFDVSLNIDNKALFVEFPDGWTVEYATLDLVKAAVELHKKKVEG
jgi:hypothetical protein